MTTETNELQPVTPESVTSALEAESSLDDLGLDGETTVTQHSNQRIEAMSVDAQTAIDSGPKQVESSATALGYGAEQIKVLEEGEGIKDKLYKIQVQIEKLIKDVISQIRQITARESGVENQETTEVMERSQEERARMLTQVLTSEITSTGLDLVPFAGGGKMIVESIAGKKLTGKQLSGKSRIIHGAMGAGSLVLDLTGIGEAKDAAILAGKSVGIFEKIAAKLGEKGVARAAKIFLTTGRFMADHPEITAKAERFADQQIRAQIEGIEGYRAQAA
jgi:hypothetical protein